MMTMNEMILDDTALNAVVGGACSIVASGSGYYASGDAPLWSVGEVLRVKYCESSGTICRGKCLVQGVSSSKTSGISGQEYSYTVQILWLPASCSAATTDIGKVYTVSESALARE